MIFMIKLNIQINKNTGLLNVLCLGAHCDDIELGCGGTVLALAESHPDIIIHWVVFASNPVRKQEALASANAFLSNVAHKNIIISEFRESFFPYVGSEIKGNFEKIKTDFSPDLVFTHYRDDRHQDHRVISDLTWNTFRDHLILEYEILKYDGDIGNPNAYISLTRSQCERKLDLINEHFISQREKTWFDREAFMAMLRLRGVECNAQEGLAEAFYSRKFTIANESQL